ncbi:LiaF domain-containing protein [Spirilliplanes yamanashiensis]|uniref:Cell wall-active antibiotics response LiaF-like C-terminal domain-containing protein n=1 Tax=Spirilliplanes yamanashiensis TaxID=42233 RepID=A0A8J3YFJ4_9ACTN|nr:LiaF domain-containing protein [Spirilliplanes yamanashiensis]MDP9818229.1 hypothetical protein [Spirilliplanes yamanashiensis]GIJ06743.1 hypothetical protein Sya03_60950 [Spirilliplanes yamanashiensis]
MTAVTDRPATTAAPVPSTATRPREGVRWSRLIAGVLIVAVGAGWFLDQLGVSVPWRLAPAAGLVVVGAALLVAREGRGLLIGTGVVLAAAALLAPLPTGHFAGPVGTRAVVPAAADWPVEATISAGELTVDLTRNPLPAGGRVTVRVGVGDLRIVVPAAGVRVDARTGLGDIRVDGRTADQGYAPVWTEGPDDADAVRLDADVAVGSIDLRHG